jgi:hypothetical protein
MNTLSILTDFFEMCALINFLILVTASVALLIFRKYILKLHVKITGLEKHDLNLAYFKYMANFKVAFIIFSLVPYLALKIIS